MAARRVEVRLVVGVEARRHGSSPSWMVRSA
jgi:hypothetical protein